MVASLQYCESCRNAFKQLGIFMVPSLYIMEVILYANNLGLARNTNTHNHNTKYASDFVLPSQRMSLFATKLSYASARLYNLLPFEIKKGNQISLKDYIKETTLCPKPSTAWLNLLRD
ncbi:hypothetical protein J6590_105708 [Homalodisca vitripennis]|nr:hypothetical protein J6590_105708 [Homalodisca vitripennis]